MGRAGIEPATHGFSVPEKPRFSPRKGQFDDIEIPGITLKNKVDLCRDTGAIAPCIVAIETNARADRKLSFHPRIPAAGVARRRAARVRVEQPSLYRWSDDRIR